MKKSFEELVKQMDVLQESEQGMLKGGFSSFSAGHTAKGSSTNSGCVNVNCDCGDGGGTTTTTTTTTTTGG